MVDITLSLSIYVDHVDLLFCSCIASNEVMVNTFTSKRLLV